MTREEYVREHPAAARFDAALDAFYARRGRSYQGRNPWPCCVHSFQALSGDIDKLIETGEWICGGCTARWFWKKDIRRWSRGRKEAAQ